MHRFFACFFFLIPLQLCAQLAPDFNATDALGQSHQLYADYLNQGKTVLLEFFYTSCAPCVESAPQFQALYEHWGAGEGAVEFMSISEQDNDFLIQDYLATLHVSFPAIGTDGGGEEIVATYTTGEFGEFYGFPTYIVIAPDGSMIFNVGEDDLETLFLINQYLEQSTSNLTLSLSEDEASADFTLRNFDISINNGQRLPVRVANLSGQIVFQEDQCAGQIFTTLPNGIYFVQIGTENFKVSWVK